MPYTESEKAAGRAFRDQAQADLTAHIAAHPPTYTVPHLISILRHACPARGDRSTALELKEIYLRSPAVGDVPEGRFGFISKQGRCRLCDQTAASTEGRLVDAWTRPPLGGRVAR